MKLRFFANSYDSLLNTEMLMSLADILFNFFFISNFTTDIDECETNPHKCHEEAACNNTHGSYLCTCKPGFIGDGQNCTGTINSLKSLQIHVDQYNELLFTWLFVVVVYFGNVASHVLILQNRWGSWATKSYNVIVFSKTTCFLHVRQSRVLGSQQKV